MQIFLCCVIKSKSKHKKKIKLSGRCVSLKMHENAQWKKSSVYLKLDKIFIID